MSFQPAFNARLIAEVKKYPCLYNHSKRGSGDTMERMRIWENIAAAVDSNCSGWSRQGLGVNCCAKYCRCFR